MRNVYPVDSVVLHAGQATAPRPKERPLTLIAPGSQSLCKGTPYLLAAFRLVIKKLPTARLVMNRVIFDNVTEIVRENSDLPIDWEPTLPHKQLGERMRACDLVDPAVAGRWFRAHRHGRAGVRFAGHHHAEHRRERMDPTRQQRRSRAHPRSTSHRRRGVQVGG